MANGTCTAITIGATLVIAMVLIGLRKYQAGMPLVSTYSSVMSAACHQPLPQDKDAYLLPVQWGVESVDSDSRVGHCCFTTRRDVAPPIPGNYYA